MYRERHNATQEFLELHDGVVGRKERGLGGKTDVRAQVRPTPQKRRHSSRNYQGVSREMRPGPGRSATNGKKKKGAYRAR